MLIRHVAGWHLSRKAVGLGPAVLVTNWKVISRRGVIHHVKEELADNAAHRERARRAQGGHWQVGLGLCDAGKSTYPARIDPIKDLCPRPTLQPWTH